MKNQGGRKTAALIFAIALIRTQPARDLAGRIALKRPRGILDIGCGPGNSTAVLKEMFPQAAILGIDNSKEMIEKARTAHPDIPFQLCDITGGLEECKTYDIIFSNACLQWVAGHRKLIPALFNKLNRGGVLAVQMPMNGQETIYRILDEVLSEPQWDFSSVEPAANTTLLP